MGNYVNEFKVFIAGVLLSLNVDLDIASVLCWMMVLDLLFGGAKALLVSELKFSFGLMFKGFTLKILVLLIPITFAIACKGMGLGDTTMLVKILFKLFIIAEAFSIMNNFQSIRKNKNLKQTDLISLIVDAVQGWLKRRFDSVLKSFDK